MTRMNIHWRRIEAQYLCPVCGFAGYFDEQAFDEGGGSVGNGICPCCFFEPGFDDDPGACAEARPTVRETIVTCRERWVADGMPWRRGTRQQRIAIGVYDSSRCSDDAPPGWSPTQQLARLLRLAPDLR